MRDDAQKLLDEITTRGLLPFNALMGSCVNSKTFDEVSRLFKELPEILSIIPDIVSHNTAIKAFCEMGSLDSASLMLVKMEKKGVEPDLITHTMFIDAFCNNGKFVNGENTWERMVEKNRAPDIRTYNARLRGLVTEKRTKDAVELVGEIRSKGLKLDVFSFNTLIRAYINEGMRATEFEDVIKINGCAPQPDKVAFELLKPVPLISEKGGGDFAYGICKVVMIKTNGCVPLPNKVLFELLELVPLISEKGAGDFAYEVCKEAIGTRHSGKLLVDESLQQYVVDELVRRSKSEEALKLVQLAHVWNDPHYQELHLPLCLFTRFDVS